MLWRSVSGWRRALLSQGAGRIIARERATPLAGQDRELAERSVRSGRRDARRSERWAVELERGIANSTFRRIQMRH